MSDIVAQLGKDGKRNLKYVSQQTGIFESCGTKTRVQTITVVPIVTGIVLIQIIGV
jgi:hypothetical protein